MVRAAHVRSRVALGACASHCDALHTVSAVQFLSDVGVGATDSHSAAPHTVSGLHWRSDSASAATLSYSTAQLQLDTMAQSRSAVVFGAMAWYSVKVSHTVQGVQVSPSPQYSPVHPQVRSDIAEALSTCWPLALHTVKFAHSRSVVMLGPAVSY